MKHVLALAACTLVLAACGGGGGGGGASNDFVVDGVAAKGRISAGIAEALSVTPTGTTVLGSATVTDGVYKLRFSGPPAQPYVIRVTASAGATHLDEQTQTPKLLPPGFTMRAAVVPPSNGNISVNVTPFTEMATAAAARLNGGLASGSNVKQGNLIVGTILGLDHAQDLPSVTPTSTVTAAITPALSPDEQRLAVMMAAVSEMVNNGAAGCAGTDAAKAGCVVQALSTAVGTSTLSLGATVTNALTTAAQDVLNKAPDAVDPGVVNVSTVQCSGASCTPPQAQDDTTASAIAATKTLFSEIRSDIASLFGDASTTGDAIVQGDQFRAAVNGAQAPADMVIRDTAVLDRGIELWRNAKLGSNVMFSSGKADVLGTDSTSSPQGARCRLYQDSGLATQATSGANANFIGCVTPYHYIAATNTEYLHAFTITPPASASGTVFSYTARAVSRTMANPPVANNVSPLPAPSAGLATGTVTAVFNTDSQLTAWTATGTVPGAFKVGSPVLASDHDSWNISGTRNFTATATATVGLSGTVTSMNTAGTTLGTLLIKSGSLNIVPAAPGSTDGVANAVSLDVQWTVPNAGTTPGAQFEGTISAGSVQSDASGNNQSPTQASITGRLATVTSTATTDFLSGTLSVTLTGYGSFNETQPKSSSNFFTIGTSFSGMVTAPGRPQLLVTASSSMRNYESGPSTATVQYRSMSGSTVRAAINVNVTTDSTGHPVLAVSETTHNLSTTITSTGKHAVLFGTTKIGEYDAATGTFTFTDGSGMSAI